MMWYDKAWDGRYDEPRIRDDNNNNDNNDNRKFGKIAMHCNLKPTDVAPAVLGCFLLFASSYQNSRI